MSVHRIPHTPGPWGVETLGHTLRVVRNRTGADLALVGDAAHLENFANANLMAAAPELLAAVEELVHGDGTSDSLQRTIDLALAALAKAKGVQS